MTGKEWSVLGAGVALIWDLVQADKHQQSCASCQNRDYLEIALDVVHLIRALGG